jgi:SAM-dependent methyltransferase
VLLVLVLLGTALALVVIVPHYVKLPTEPDDPDALAARLLRGGLMFGVPSAAAFALVRRPARYALSLAALFVAGAFDPGPFGETLHMERNFFGVVRVTRDGKFIKLIHGTTLHGQQRADEPDGPQGPRPMTYYHQKGPVGKLFAALPPERLKRVGAVGLGTGAVAFYAQRGQDWTFFEIDPAVARIANDPAYFRFLSSCRERGISCDVILGDARRSLVRLPDQQFDLIILDGFCSDAIPVHLLTREAFQLYFQKLAPGGLLAVHISNNHLDLPPLVARIARHGMDSPLVVRYCHDIATEDQRRDGKTDSQWMVVARTEDDLGKVGTNAYWDKLPDVPGPVWRDDFANLLKVWKKQEEN